jgi:[ribosomal protein S18]-alanine N-acetyltransferase
MAQSMDLNIRKMLNRDEAQVCARLMSASEPWVTLGRSCDDSMKQLLDPSKEIYLALSGDTVTGFIVLVLNGAFTGYIQTIGVMPEWRNKGIGSRLLKFAEDLILEKSPNVFICVSSFNGAAQRLYERRGYEEVGELKNYVASGYDEILMRKTTGPLKDFRGK